MEPLSRSQSVRPCRVAPRTRERRHSFRTECAVFQGPRVVLHARDLVVQSHARWGCLAHRAWPSRVVVLSEWPVSLASHRGCSVLRSLAQFCTHANRFTPGLLVIGRQDSPDGQRAMGLEIRYEFTLVRRTCRVALQSCEKRKRCRVQLLCVAGRCQHARGLELSLIHI